MNTLSTSKKYGNYLCYTMKEALISFKPSGRKYSGDHIFRINQELMKNLFISMEITLGKNSQCFIQNKSQ